MTTRAQILADAFEAIGIADYVFNVTPSEAASARRRLNAMMAQWEAEGVTLGYVASDDFTSDAEIIPTPDWADDAIATNLALRIAPSFGKTPIAETKRAAKVGYGLLVARTIKIPRMANPLLRIRGGGDRWSVPHGGECASPVTPPAPIPDPDPDPVYLPPSIGALVACLA